MRFDQVFDAVAHKRLALVDLPDRNSNQHELNGTLALKDFFGSGEPSRGGITWIRFAEVDEPVTVTGTYTFYDARAKSVARTGRSEWRFYYTGEPLAGANPGDLLVLARSADTNLFALVFQQDSGWERAARSLFPIDTGTEQLHFVEPSALRSTDLDITRRAILERLGFDYVIPSRPEHTDLVLERFGLAFPSTKEMGALARELAPPDAADPDLTLMSWLDMEEQLFKALERLIVGEQIERGFQDVEEFLSFSLSVQNRRKSRAGHAFENHLAALFDLQGLRYSRQVRTEGNRTADFVFPGVDEYRDEAFPAAALLMLAAKTTCKDRWPQVLADADRILPKHLGTIDAALSSQQLLDMTTKSIIPVMPGPILAAYAHDPSVGRILDLAGFIDVVHRLHR